MLRNVIYSPYIVFAFLWILLFLWPFGHRHFGLSFDGSFLNPRMLTYLKIHLTHLFLFLLVPCLPLHNPWFHSRVLAWKNTKLFGSSLIFFHSSVYTSSKLFPRLLLCLVSWFNILPWLPWLWNHCGSIATSYKILESEIFYHIILYYIISYCRTVTE
jgi:hypothetical protein